MPEPDESTPLSESLDALIQELEGQPPEPRIEVREPESATDLVAYEAIADEEEAPLVLDTTEKKPRPKPKMSVQQIVSHYGKPNASQTIIAQEKAKAILANREIIRRMATDPMQFKIGELNFTAGTAVDKIAKKERWDKAGDEGPKTFMLSFVEAIQRLQGEGGLKLSLEVVNPARERAEVTVLPPIDVPVLEESNGSEAHPRVDEALERARLYLTSKDRIDGLVLEFEALTRKVVVPAERRRALVLAWQERMNNIGKLSVTAAELEGQKMARYAAGHPERMRAFVLSWLEIRRGMSEPGDERIVELERALIRALKE